jgi:FkbM family methyltransferase
MEVLLNSPGVPASLFLAVGLALLFLVPMCFMLCSGRGSGVGNTSTFGQSGFSLYVRAGRIRNLLCSPCDRVRQRYPLANTCQVPFLSSLSDVYTFVFGYKTDGLFLEVGAYDGESFSNTSGLADIGWAGHYFEPVPEYADAARERHAGNAPRVQVHTVAVSEKDGDTIMVSAAGPFSSAVEDEISTVNASTLSATLSALGWSHKVDSPRVPATTVSLNSFCTKNAIAPKQVDVMVRAGRACRPPPPPSLTPAPHCAPPGDRR